MIEIEKKLLSANGWIAAVILTACTFGAYYFLVFPQLANQNEEVFYRQVKIADENTIFQIEANIPKYLSNFQESILILNIACNPPEENESAQGCDGLLDLVSFLIEDGNEIGDSHVTLRRLDLKDQPAVVRNLYIKYDLKAYEVMSVPISVQISSGNGEYVALSVYDNPPTGLAVKWSDVTCKTDDETDDKMDDKMDDNIWICAKIDSGKALQQSGVENLLLPPWSNRLILFIAFAMIWLAEQVLSYKETRDEQPNAWLLYLAGLGAYFLFLFYAVLYLYLLTDIPLIALFYAVLLIFYIITLPKLFS